MVVGICMCKDEADIIERTMEHMAHECDGLLIADNGSTDGTREFLRGFEERTPNVVILDDPDPAYYQSAKMSRLAEQARTHMEATWILPVDADERWRPNNGRVPISEQLMALPAEALLCEAAVLDHVATGDPEMPWRRIEQLPLRKVACRAVEGLVIHQGNHGATFPDVEPPLTVTGRLEIRHFPYRTPEQFIKKVRNGAAAYRATDLPENIGTHWRHYDRWGDDELRGIFFEWFHSTDPENDPKLIYDPCPTLSKSLSP